MAARLLSVLLLALALACPAARADEARGAKINIAALPLGLALKQVHGSGRRLLVTFEDPNCIFCKRMAKDLSQLDDVTIYTFVYPILSADSRDKARAIWCAADRAKAWRDWMRAGMSPRAATCDTRALDEVLAVGRSLKIRSTPTLFLADGERLVGAQDRIDLELAISSPAAMAAPGVGLP